MSDSDQTPTETERVVGGAYPVEEHLRAQREQPGPDGHTPVHAPVTEPETGDDQGDAGS